jgi:uncharacterized protein with von Willebrand factor type A (vWA) domain
VIAGLCGFAELLRRNGAEVGSAELIDTARALTVVDLGDRDAVRLAVRCSLAWSAVDPEGFDRLFDEWFSGRHLGVGEAEPAGSGPADDQPAVALDAEAVAAARIHTDDEMMVETDQATEPEADGVSGRDRSGERGPAPIDRSSSDGLPTEAGGTEVAAAPRDASGDDKARPGPEVVELPDAPLAEELELARTALSAAMERRRQVAVAAGPLRRARAVTQPLTAEERVVLERCVRRIDRHLDGARSWRRAPARTGPVDLRRTMRRTVTSGGFPLDLHHTGRRTDAARLVVLVDLSMSVRGTARLVLHLVHRMRSAVGTLRAFGFVDSCVPIDRALRVSDPAVAIDRVFGLVDADAPSDPGRAFRQWWTRSNHLVTPASHVVILSDGRCNGRDPAVAVIDRVTRRSASTWWVSPEPVGAWTLGRGEMADYAERVDRAVSVRSLGDLDGLVPSSGRDLRRSARG